MKNKLLATIVTLVLLIGAFSMAFSFTRTSKADNMYYLDVKADPDVVTINGTGWYTDHSIVDLEAPIIVDGPGCSEYRFWRWEKDGNPVGTVWNPNYKCYIDGKNVSVVGYYLQRFNLTFTTGYEDKGVLPWIDDGGGWVQTSSKLIWKYNLVRIGVTGLLGGANKYVIVAPNVLAYFVNFTGIGIATTTATGYESNWFNMTTCMSPIIEWKFRYYLYVTGHPKSWWKPPGEDWYYEGDIASLTADKVKNPVSYGCGDYSRWAFDRWEVNPPNHNGVPDVYSPDGLTVNITMNTNKTADCYYKLQFFTSVYDTYWTTMWNKTSLWANYTGWHDNCTTLKMNAPEFIYDGMPAGWRLRFFGWFSGGGDLYGTAPYVEIHVNGTLPAYPCIHIQARYRPQVRLLLTSGYLSAGPDPFLAPGSNTTGWYDKDAVLNITALVRINITECSRWLFKGWNNTYGWSTTSNIVHPLTMNKPFNFTAWYTKEYRIVRKVRDGKTMAELTVAGYPKEEWREEGEHVWYNPVMSVGTYVFFHWTDNDVDLPESVSKIHLDNKSLAGCHDLWINMANKTAILISPNIHVYGPCVVCTTFDIDVTLANFNSKRTDGSGQPMDVYGWQFKITWDASLITCTGVDLNLDNIWGAGNWICALDDLSIPGEYRFAGCAMNNVTGFECTKLFATLHFHVIDEPCYKWYDYTDSCPITMTESDLVNHLGNKIVQEVYQPSSYTIQAVKPACVLKRKIDGTKLLAEVEAFDVVNMNSYEIQYSFDTSVLQVQCIEVTNFLPGPYTYKFVDYNNAAGKIYVRVQQQHPPAPLICGDGVLFKITFKLVGPPYVGMISADFIKFDVYCTGLYTQQHRPWDPPKDEISGKVDFALNPLLGDVNYDGVVNVLDLQIVADHFSPIGGFDLNNDCKTDIFDLVIVALRLGDTL